MKDKEIYQEIDTTITDSEEAANPGRYGLNVASDRILPEEYISRVSHLNGHVDESDLRQHIEAKVRRGIGVRELSEKFSSGEFGSPILSRRAARALAEKFINMQ